MAERHGPGDPRADPCTDPYMDALRELWRSVRSDHSPERAGDELERTDASTRAAVEWMRAAWAGLEIPEPAPPFESRAAASHRGRVVALGRRALPGALRAAAVILTLGATVWLLTDGGDGEERFAARRDGGVGATRDRVALGARVPEGASAATVETGGAARSQPMVSTSNESNGTRGARSESRVRSLVPSVGTDNLEFRSGAVRLVLVTTAPERLPMDGERR